MKISCKVAVLALLSWFCSSSEAQHLRPAAAFPTALVQVPLGAGACDYCTSTGLCCSVVCPEYGYPYAACQASTDCYDDGVYLYCLCSQTAVCAAFEQQQEEAVVLYEADAEEDLMPVQHRV